MPKHALIFQKHLVVYGASTLARMKIASLFRIAKKDIPNYLECIHYFNNQCSPYGYKLCILSEDETSLLVYVYNARKLTNLLAEPAIKNFLSDYGYKQCQTSRALQHLQTRIHSNLDFPHEIGIFLGYPLQDVQAFMCPCKKCLYIGHWKVYGNVKKSKKTFERFDCCRKTMETRIAQGETLVQILKKCNEHTSHLS